MKTVKEMKNNELSPRLANRILQNSYVITKGRRDVTLEDIAKYFTYEDVIRWRNCGKGLTNELVKVMKDHGLQLKHEYEKREEEEKEEKKELVLEKIEFDYDNKAVGIIKQKLADIEEQMSQLSTEWNVLAELLMVIENESE